MTPLIISTALSKRLELDNKDVHNIGTTMVMVSVIAGERLGSELRGFRKECYFSFVGSIAAIACIYFKFPGLPLSKLAQISYAVSASVTLFLPARFSNNQHIVHIIIPANI